MRAVVLREYSANVLDAIRGLTVEERPVPALKHGQVLVRIEAAPCNPSDLLLLQGKYGTLKTLPTVPGWEGTGTVVASGGGLMGTWLQGKRVSCAVREDRDGTWAEYLVANARDCIPLKRSVPTEQAASLIVNPFTAFGLVDTAKRAGHRALVQTAAASQLGRMILVVAKDESMPLINIVRREAQVELLKSLGAEHVLNSSDEDFWDEFRQLAQRLRATAMFEAISGEITGQLLSTMPPKSAAYLYGALSEEPVSGIDPIEVVFHDKSLHGFFLGNWLDERGILTALRTASRVQNLLASGRIGTTVQQRLKLDEAVDGLQRYAQNMTDGKALIMPHCQ